MQSDFTTPLFTRVLVYIFLADMRQHAHEPKWWWSLNTEIILLRRAASASKRRLHHRDQKVI